MYMNTLEDKFMNNKAKVIENIKEIRQKYNSSPKPSENKPKN